MIDFKEIEKNCENINGYKIVEVKNGDGFDKAIYIKGKNEIKLVPIKSDVQKIYLELTTQCNFECETCIRNVWQEELGTMNMALLEKVVNQLYQFPQLKTVHLGGFGEPLSHPNVLEIIKQIRAKNVDVEIVTNGSLLNEKIIMQLIKLGVRDIYVSIDEGNVDDFERIRKGSDYSGLIQNLIRFKELKEELGVKFPRLNFAFVAMKQNITALPRIIELGNNVLVSNVLVTNLLPYQEEMKDQIVYDIEDAIPIYGDQSFKPIMRANLPPFKLRTYRNCKFISDKSLCITWEGEVAPCYPLMHSHNCYIYDRKKQVRSHSFGNVNERALADIWCNPEYIRFRLTLENDNYPSCTDCRSLEGCSYVDDNDSDCWGNSPSCADCLWSREMIICP